MAGKGRKEWDMGSNFHPTLLGQMWHLRELVLVRLRYSVCWVKSKPSPPGRGWVWGPGEERNLEGKPGYARELH